MKQRSPGYSRSLRTQAAILRAAMREFATHGIAGARVDRIARAAGVNNHALYYHFGDKDGLFRVVLRQGYESFSARRRTDVAKIADPVKGMEKVICDVFDFVQSSREHMAIAMEVNRQRGANLDPEGRRQVRIAAAPLLRDVETLVRKGKARGCFARATNAEQLYFTIFALCSFYFSNAYTVSAVVGHDLLTPAAIRSRRKEICRFVLAGLRP